MTGATLGSLKVAVHLQLPHFLVITVIINVFQEVGEHDDDMAVPERR